MEVEQRQAEQAPKLVVAAVAALGVLPLGMTAHALLPAGRHWATLQKVVGEEPAMTIAEVVAEAVVWALMLVPGEAVPTSEGVVREELVHQVMEEAEAVPRLV